MLTDKEFEHYAKIWIKMQFDDTNRSGTIDALMLRACMWSRQLHEIQRLRQIAEIKKLLKIEILKNSL